MNHGNAPSQAATLAASMSSLGRPPQLGDRPISEAPFSAQGPSHTAAWNIGSAPVGGPTPGPTNGSPHAMLLQLLTAKYLGQTRHPDPLNQQALLARFLGAK